MGVCVGVCVCVCDVGVCGVIYGCVCVCVCITRFFVRNRTEVLLFVSELSLISRMRNYAVSEQFTSPPPPTVRTS